MKIIYAIATISGTIIGAGLFALPYITLKVGFGVILAYFLVLGSLVVLIHLFFGELSLKTPDFKRLPGFTKIYLGKPGQAVAYTSTILGLFGALLAYLILGGEFLTKLTELILPALGGNNLFYTLFYFVIGAFLIFYGIKAIEKVEFWGLVLFLIILFAVFIKGMSFINIENLFIGQCSIGNGQWSSLFLPYGAILFSLWGAALIPEAEEILGERKKMLLKIIPITILIPALVYLFFIYITLGITGLQTTEDALSGLTNVLGDGIVVLALLFGLLTTFTSFVALGLALKKVFRYDLKFSKNLAWAITCFLPLILYLIGIKSFIAVIGVVGGMMLAVDGILILLMYKKIRPERAYLVYSLIFVLLGGIIYSVIYYS
ncbi:MAG TPA: aromatic amino acid transport family protein [Candidatus Humimicrobiaceae bacterium]|nr:aromatic amino acid transport family protein [Candidatus Humimicrobiaceae bacterium]